MIIKFVTDFSTKSHALIMAYWKTATRTRW